MCVMGEGDVCDGRGGEVCTSSPQGEPGAPYRGDAGQAAGHPAAEGCREHKVGVCEETSQGKWFVHVCMFVCVECVWVCVAMVCTFVQSNIVVTSVMV